MRIKLIGRQKEKLADLSIGLGHVFFGSTVVPYFLPAVDRPPLSVLIWGVIMAVGLWSFAIWIIRD